MDLFQLAAKIRLDSDGFEKGISKAEKSGKGLADNLEKSLNRIKNLFKVVVGGYATKKLFDFTKAALNASGKLEQSLGGAKAVFKEYYYFIEDEAKKAYKSLGLSQNAYLEQANKIGSLLQGSGYTEAESAQKTIEVMQRASDVASIMGIDVASAVDAVTAAAKGNFTMMDNLGVAVNATTIEQYALAKGIKKSYSEMTNAEKVGLAYDLFMEKTAKYAGNYAKENDTYAGSINTLKAAWENFMAGSGSADAVMESLEGAVKAIWKSLKKLVPTLAKGFRDLISRAIKKINIGNISFEFRKLIGSLLNMDPADVNFLSVVSVAIGKAKEYITDAKNWGKAALTEWVGLPTESEWADIVGKAIEKVAEELGNVGKWGKAEISKFFDIEGEATETWTGIAGAIITKVRKGFVNAVSTAQASFRKILGIDDPNADWGTIAGEIGKKIRGAFIGVNGAATSVVRKILGIDDESANWAVIAGVIASKIRNALVSATGVVVNTVKAILGIDDPNANWAIIAGSIAGKIRGALVAATGVAVSTVKAILGIDDPNADWKVIFGTIAQKIRGAITTATGVAISAVKAILGIDDPNATWGTIANTIGEKIRGAITTAKDAAIASVKKLLGIDDSTDLKEVGGTIAEKVLGGITWVGTSVTEFIKGLLGLDQDVGWDEIAGELIRKLGDAIKIAGGIADTLVQGFEDTIIKSGAAKNIGAEIGKSFKNFIEGLGETLFGLVGVNSGKGQNFTDTVMSNAILKAFYVIGEVLVNAFYIGIFQPIENIWIAIRDAVVNIGGTLYDAIVVPLGNFIIDGVNGIISGINALIGWTGARVGSIGHLQTREEQAAYKALHEDRMWYNQAEKSQISDVAFDLSKKMVDEYKRALEKGSEEEAQKYLDQIFKSMFDYYDLPSQIKAQREIIEAADTGRIDVTAMRDLLKFVSLSGRSFEDLGSETVSAEDALAALVDALYKAVSEISDISFISSSGGHHTGIGVKFAKGAWDIPYDDFPARLHRGEMVLNASRARDYRNGEGFGNTSAVVAAIQGLRQDMQNLQLIVGEKELGRATVQYGGARMNGYIGKAERKTAAGYGW